MVCRLDGLKKSPDRNKPGWWIGGYVTTHSTGHGSISWKSNFFNGVKGLIQMIIIISNKMLVERVVHLKIMLFVGAKFSEL